MRKVEASDVDGVADYLRQLIADHPIKPRPPNSAKKLIDELATLNRKLASIDNNMNQLARQANSGARVPEIHLQETIEHHRRLKVVAAQVLQKVATRG